MNYNLKQQKSSITNHNSLYMVPFLKNKLKKVKQKLNYPQIQIPIISKKISYEKLQNIK